MKRLLASTLAFCWLSAQAQDKIKIGTGGVEVESGGERVKVSPTAVEINDGAGNRVKVRAPAVDVDKEEETDDGDDAGRASPLPEVPAKGLRTIKPIICQGNKDQEFTRVLITGDGDGVVIQGNCDITLRDSQVDVQGYGVKVQGNGDVKLVRTFVRGKKGSVIIMGNGDVNASSSTLVGKIQKLGNGEFNDQGNNTFRQR